MVDGVPHKYSTYNTRGDCEHEGTGDMLADVSCEVPSVCNHDQQVGRGDGKREERKRREERERERETRKATVSQSIVTWTWLVFRTS